MMGQQTGVPVAPPERCYLQRCDPRSRLFAFFLLLATLIHGHHAQAGWWLALSAFALLPWLANLKLGTFFLPLWKLRFFFLVLLLLHGFFVPGSALLPFSEWPSREGFMVGGLQALRLALMASLAWVLVRVSSNEDLITGLCGLFGPLQRLGIPVTRWATLLSWTLECVGRLLTLATATREQIPHKTPEQGWLGSLTLLGHRGSLFLNAMMLDMAEQEQRLRQQGILTGLPLPEKPTPYRPGWRDVLLMLYPLLSLVTSVINDYSSLQTLGLPGSPS